MDSEYKPIVVELGHEPSCPWGTFLRQYQQRRWRIALVELMQLSLFPLLDNIFNDGEAFVFEYFRRQPYQNVGKCICEDRSGDY